MAAVPDAGRARRRLGHLGGAEVQGIEAPGRDPGCKRHQSRGFGGLAWTRDERKRWRKKARQKYLMDGWVRLWWEDAGEEVSVESKKENARLGLGEMQGGEGEGVRGSGRKKEN
ncbi:uncharacterized protein N7446_009753 [Penicillium canescens]|uniref:uncharacterized protein n=1 Tax=Penicillium canescens TaxID=5083 RepID=UPI0026DEDC92|nr:uncharacterized protein N7446_009753 [Penicillium canescens]KAJ6053741.1 hypothetical protein N7446_009753 [Penicillium canescens]